MPRATWLMRREGVYYVRARVPKDLVKIVGKAEIRRSLKTSDPKEARSRLRAVSAEIQSEFEAAGLRGAAAAVPVLQPVANSKAPSPARLRSIVRAWFAKCEERAADSELTLPAHDPEERLEVLDQDVGILSDPMNPNVMATTQGVANRLIEAHGLSVTPGSPEHGQLTELVRRVPSWRALTAPHDVPGATTGPLSMIRCSPPRPRRRQRRPQRLSRIYPSPT